MYTRCSLKGNAMDDIFKPHVYIRNKSYDPTTKIRILNSHQLESQTHIHS